MADSSTNKTRVEEYGVRSVKGRWSEWSMDGNGLDCETKEQTSGLSMEDLAWLIEPHRDALFPAESAKAEAQAARCGYLITDGQTTIGLCEHPAGHDGEHQRGVEAQPAGTGWVSVEERLPGATEQVLVVRQEPGAKSWVGHAWYRGPKRAGERRRGDWEASPWGVVNDVTHWQPMPPPPEPR